jgi:UDP-glucose 4-epimerase
MRILITGGAGYIGSHTLVELLAKGHEVCVVDNFSNSDQAALDRVSEISGKTFPHFEADIRDKSALQRIFQDFEPEAVIHFAGLKAVGESVEEPLRYYDVNVSGTLCLLAAMDLAGCKKIVFSSSATVYGEPKYLPIDEEHPCSPTNPYGRTKLIGEQILTDWQKATPNSSAVLLRYFNPVGAHESGLIGENPRGTPNNLFPYLARVAVGKREKLLIFGNDYETPDGTGIRDYIHVVDLARAHVSAMDFVCSKQGVETFNIGTEKGYSVSEIVNAFSLTLGRNIPVEIVPRRKGDIACSFADPARANTVLGWCANLGLGEMCASTWNWQSQNPNGLHNKSPHSIQRKTFPKNTNVSEDFKTRLDALGDFWERIDFPNGVTVGPGRNKEILWRDYLSHYIDKALLTGKRVLDIGCNAGGNLVEIAKANPAQLVGLEANTTFYNQALFVVEHFAIDAEVRQYRISQNKVASDYAADLGRFDVIFLLGVVYHLNRMTNLGILRYIRENCENCYFSSQLFSSERRHQVDWELTREGHEDLFREAGFTTFTTFTTIYEKKDTDNWSGLTNQWYFEAR